MFKKLGRKNPCCYGDCVGNFKFEHVYTMSRLIMDNNIQFVILTEELARGEINFICSVFSEFESIVETKEKLCFDFYDGFIDLGDTKAQS